MYYLIKDNKMTSADIVKMYDAKLEGQQLLFPDDDIVLRHTNFKKISPEFDRAALIHWWMNVHLPEYHGADEKTPFPVYQTWSHAIWEYFKYTNLNCCNPEINQQEVTFTGYLKEPNDEQTEELRLWIPHIRFCINKDNGRSGKYIGILEHKLSVDGIWQLWIYDESDIELGRTRNGHYEKRANFDCLGKAVWFISNHYWYDKKLRR